MASLSPFVIDLVEASISCPSPDAVGRSFFNSLKPFGVNAFNARAYHSGVTREDEQIYFRLAPPSFMPVYDDTRFYDFNPLPSAGRRRVLPFRWSDIPWIGRSIWVRETMRDCGHPDGIIVPCHGPDNYLGIVSMAFERLDEVAPAERAAIELASHVLHGRMRNLAKPFPPARAAALSERERDCLWFVADGRSDADIAAAMGISRTTVATHLLHARQKLGAKTRAQAVAALLSASSSG